MPVKRRIISIVLLCAVVVLSYMAFAAVTDAVVIESASVFVIPAVWFFILLTVFSVGTLVWRERLHQGIASLVLIVPSLFFATTLTHVGVSILASLLTFGGLLHIGRELAARLRLSVYRSVAVGISQIVLALALVISSHYYAQIHALSWNQLVPSFDLADGTGAWMLRLASRLSPSLATLENERVSVDHFFRELRPGVVADDVGNAVGDEVSEALRQAEITRSKLQLSRLLGREVGGDESMSVILSEVLHKKVIAFVSSTPAGEGKSIPFFPFFLTILLFLTIYPLGSVLAPLALSLATLVFALLIRSGWISLKHVSTEQEVIL